MLGTAAYGERFACAVERPPLYGVQFHPEKSSAAGLRAARELHAHLRACRALILYPAIDIRDGRAVRLMQGDYDRETAYEDDPVVAARRWERRRARRWLHVVDLDGARAGEPVNLDHVRRIVAARRHPGPARRRPARLRQGRGGDLAPGSSASSSAPPPSATPTMAEAIASAHGDRVVAAVDARAGKVAAEGWTEPSGVGPAELAAELAERGRASASSTRPSRSTG